jgi:exopolysaccharide/PEP-CTERM locus tyrosine autokinase
MNQHTPLRTGGSLLERAAELYGFGFDAPAEPVRAPAPAPAPAAKAPAPEAPAPQPRRVSRGPAPAGPAVAIDRERLREGGFIVPEAAGGALAEEFRIVKRQLLADAASAEDARTVLICSAQPDEGKTFCALNLALSLAAERDVEVLLVDADFPKPEILSILGVEAEAGLVDTLSDPEVDPEALVLRTDVRGLSLLPAGRHAPNVTELLASERTREVISRLTSVNPRRIVLFDSPPALMASPAAVLAGRVGQLLMVVRADRTTEADLREAVALLSACEKVRLLLNAAAFGVSGRRFGTYYGYGE